MLTGLRAGEEEVLRALFGQAVDHHKAGRLGMAAALYRALLALGCADTAVTGNLELLLGQVLAAAVGRLEAGEPAEAADLARWALGHRPGRDDAWRLLAMAERRRDRPQVAAAALARALALAPGVAEGYAEAGRQAEHGGTPGGDTAGAAVRHWDRTARLAPLEPQPAATLALARHRAGDLKGAEAAHRRALALAPADAAGWSNLGSVALETARPAAAHQHFRRAQALAPDLAEAHWGEAKALLLLGDARAGWAKVPWHRRRPGRASRFPNATAWDGGPLEGRTLLLHAELGHGDTILAARYAAWAAGQGGRVVAMVQKPLVRLLAGIPGLSGCTALDEPPPAFDRQCPMLDLPRLFMASRRPEEPPEGPVPAPAYLVADPALAGAWGGRLAAVRRPRVGLAWASAARRGGFDEAMARRRNPPADLLGRFGRVTGVAFVSLQKGEPGAPPPPLAGMALLDLMDEVADFADTAALMAGLDLVIAVDTAVAHLAGALGVPVWVPMRHEAGFPWRLDGDETPWYGSMRLFRQPEPGNWGTVLDRMAAALAQRFAAHGHHSLQSGDDTG